MLKALARPVIVVAHDAGAANHIFAWLGDEQPKMCLTGPALALWRTHLQKSGRVVASGSRPSLELDHAKSSIADSSLAAAIAGAATVITGTGWESSLEHNARKLAGEKGIRSIAVIDHWTNYANRFIRKGEQVLPDEIWVSDRYASDIARATFPTVRIVQRVNAYLAGLVTEVESRQTATASEGNDRVLYVLEPIRQAWGDLVEPGEFMALDYFMTQLERVPVAKNAEIRLRPHPSDPLGKYDSWLKRQPDKRVSLDRSASLADALAWSNVVAGCQTYAMVLALACKRTVVSTIPPWAPPCVLPHRDIVRLSLLRDGRENETEFTSVTINQSGNSSIS